MHLLDAFSLYFTLLFHFCSAALCTEPLDINYAMVTVSGTSIGDNAIYTCNPGFELIGDEITVCTEVDANSAVYIPEQPSCRREQI